LKLSEIINLEYQLYRDAQSDPVIVRERDRKIGRGYTGSELDRASLFRFWLNKLENKSTYPGRSWSSGLAFLRYSVFFFFFISGAMTCAGVLAYDGSQPVNIVNFLAVFIGVQILFYLLFFLNILPGKIRGKIPFIGDFYRFVGFLSNWIILTVSNHLYKNKTGSIRQITNILHRAKSRHMIYNKIERWTLFSVTQLGGFGFSSGALAICAYLITFSDLAFAWNTTLDVSPDFFHKIVTAISAPWAMFSKGLVPTSELVESTRFFRLDESYSGAQSSALLVGGWWPFLICVLLTYGLIPRFIFLILSRFNARRSRARAPFLSAELDSLHRRLTSPIFSTQAGATGHTENKSEKLPLKNINELSPKSEDCYLIVWQEIELSEARMREIVQSRFHWNLLETFYAGMLENDQDERTLKHFSRNVGDEPILVLLEAWEAPSKAIARFLSLLRMNIKENRMIVIGLINLDSDNKIISPAQTDWQNWQDAAVKLHDPFVCIEPVAEAS